MPVRLILLLKKIHYLVFFLAVISPLVSYIIFKVEPKLLDAKEFLLKKKEGVLFALWCICYVCFVFFNKSLHLTFLEKNVIALFFSCLGFVMFSCRMPVPKKSVMQIWKEAGGIWVYQSMVGTLLFSAMRTVHINPDSQKLAQRFHDVTVASFSTGSLIRIPNLIAEEFFCCFLFAVAFSLFRKRIFSAVLVALVFGCLHITAWNPQTALSIFTTRLVVEGCWLMLLDIRPFIVFHVANNLISSSVILGKYFFAIRTVLMLVLVAPFCVEMAKRLLRK